MTYDELRESVSRIAGYRSFAALPSQLRARLDRCLADAEGDIRTRAPWIWLISSPDIDNGTVGDITQYRTAYMVIRSHAKAGGKIYPTDTGKGLIHVAFRDERGASTGHKFVMLVPPDIFFQRAIENESAALDSTPTIGTLIWDQTDDTLPWLLVTPISTLTNPGGSIIDYTVRQFTDALEMSSTLRTVIPSDLHELLLLGAGWRFAASDQTGWPKVEALRKSYEERMTVHLKAQALRFGSLDYTKAFEAGRERWRTHAQRREPSPTS